MSIFFSLPLALIRLPILHPFVFCIGFVRTFSRALFQLDGISMAVRLDQRDGSPSPPEQELWPHDFTMSNAKEIAYFLRTRTVEQIHRATTSHRGHSQGSVLQCHILLVLDPTRQCAGSLSSSPTCRIPWRAPNTGRPERFYNSPAQPLCRACTILGSLREMPSNSVT